MRQHETGLVKHAGRIRMRALVAAIAATLGVVAMTADTQARVPERPVVTITCPADTAQDDALCAAIAQALGDMAASGAVIVRHKGDMDPTLRPGDLGIVFVLDARDDTGLAGHLEWQTGPDAPLRTGPQVRLDVMDSTLSPAMYQNFARGLVQIDPDLQDQLQSPVRP